MEIVEGTAEITDVDEFLDTVDEIATAHGVTMQTIDARYVAGREQLERALTLADRAIERGDEIARQRDVELLCHVAATRQIERAFDLGLTPGEQRIVVLIDGQKANPGVEANEAAAAEEVRSMIDPGQFETIASDEETLRSWFDVGDAELAATNVDLETLVVERIALLVLDR